MRIASIGRFFERVVPPALGLTLACLILPALLRSHHDTETPLAVAFWVGITLGVVARVGSAAVARGATVATAGLAVTFAAAFVVDRVFGDDGVRHLDAISIMDVCVTCLCVAALGTGWPWRRRFAGFAVALSPFAFLTHSATLLAIVGFLFARDVAAEDHGAPARQSLALLGVGVLMMLAAQGFGFDLGVLLDTQSAQDGRSWMDGPAARWARMATELLLLAACAAQLRGRTWGVLAIAPLSVVLVYFVQGRLPVYGHGGCLVTVHPLYDVFGTPFLIAGVVAVVPWVVPMLLKLRAPPLQDG